MARTALSGEEQYTLLDSVTSQLKSDAELWQSAVIDCRWKSECFQRWLPLSAVAFFQNCCTRFGRLEPDPDTDSSDKFSGVAMGATSWLLYICRASSGSTLGS